MIVRNGFDEEMLSTLNLKENIYQKKENAILTVGRLGTYVKNTEMLLRALKQIDLKDWKFYFVGPIETDFKPCISDFFNRYPEKRSSVIFVGAIYDKRELWEYYNRAKVFVLPSRSECYALVLNEALRFRNYLILTDVGAASDVIQEGKYGSLIEQDDDKMLAQRIQDIIDGKIDIDVFSDFDPQMISWDRIIDDFFTNSSL